METIEIRIERKDVYEEVAKTTDYTGSKLIESDEGARDRILSTDEDLKTLGRFWEESVAVANDRLKGMYVEGSLPSAEVYEATLEVSVAFDKALVPSVRAALRSYFIKSIVGKWYRFTNKSESGDYFAEAGMMMEDAMRKLYSRKRPRRPQ